MYCSDFGPEIEWRDDLELWRPSCTLALQGATGNLLPGIVTPILCIYQLPGGYVGECLYYRSETTRLTR